MFEGVPTFPDASRFWQIVEKYKVTQFYTGMKKKKKRMMKKKREKMKEKRGRV